MRTSVSIYRALGKFVDAADAAAPAGHDPSIDAHFRSGVYLGACAVPRTHISKSHPGAIQASAR
jgi:hypothetical protein